MLKKFIIFVILNLLNAQIAFTQNGYSYPANDGFNGYQYGNGQDQMIGSIPGIPGRDYPAYATPPDTSFRCQDQAYPGYYADPEAQCQVFHICQSGNRKDSFLCTNGTLFNQEFLVCDWWTHVDCNRARDFYSINEAIQKAMEEATQRLLYEAAQRTRDQSQGYDYRNPFLIGSYNNNNNNNNGNGGYKYQDNNQVSPGRRYLPTN